VAEAVGLSLNAQAADLVQIRGNVRNPRVVKIGHVELEAPAAPAHGGGTTALGPAAPGAGGETHPWIQPLRHLVQSCHLTTPEAHIGMASETAIIRYFQMPKLPPRDRPTAIRFEAKKYLPFKLDELMADFQVAILKADPEVMRVMFYTAKKDVVSQYLQALTGAGIRPVSMEPSLSSLTRALRRNHQLEPGKVATLLCIGRDAASIAIVRDEIVYLARNVTVPAAPAPGQASGVSGTRQARQEPAGQATMHEALLSETVVSLDYYRRRFTGEPAVTKVFVSGESVPSPWLSELAGALELPVEAAEVGRGLPNGQRLIGNVAVAFGLALRGLGSGRGAVSLLPAELGPKPRGILRVVGLEVGATVALLALLHHVKAQPMRTLASQIAAVQQQGSATALGRSSSEMTVDQLQQRLAAVEGEMRFLRSVVDANLSLATVLGQLATITPPEIWLRHVTYEDAVTMRTAVDAISSSKRLAVSGSAYHPDKSAELEAINRYVAAASDDSTIQPTFGAFDLTTVQRGAVQSIEVTDFQVSSQASGQRQAS